MGHTRGNRRAELRQYVVQLSVVYNLKGWRVRFEIIRSRHARFRVIAFSRFRAGKLSFETTKFARPEIINWHHTAKQQIGNRLPPGKRFSRFVILQVG